MTKNGLGVQEASHSTLKDCLKKLKSDFLLTNKLRMQDFIILIFKELTV